MKYPTLMHNLVKVSYITTFFFIYFAVIFSNSHSVFLLSLYRAVCNSTDVLSANWRSQNPAHSSHWRNWRRLADRKASWQHWVMAKSLRGSFLESLCHIKGLCRHYCCYVLLANWFGVLQMFLRASVPQIHLHYSQSLPHVITFIQIFQAV